MLCGNTWIGAYAIRYTVTFDVVLHNSRAETLKSWPTVWYCQLCRLQNYEVANLEEITAPKTRLPAQYCCQVGTLVSGHVSQETENGPTFVQEQ
jgi:hypothetical protein